MNNFLPSSQFLISSHKKAKTTLIIRIIRLKIIMWENTEREIKVKMNASNMR